MFNSYEEAYIYSQNNPGTENPLALILQKEYIDEREPGAYIHVKRERLTEWPVEFLKCPEEPLEPYLISCLPMH